ncbi:hypothetical protein [Photorhabdus heterorhabditis]|uniref:hypothetical protein n=1 Tax=Photorhabdus heterorhabditis TaxID=880156 RepID=UPI0015628C78|nr:hypothetical protein [Photorhabdus heterorhabditis]NRN29010.1 hypothetical protein [Photorhabdus heterorhabditis subsp. aluminescens]
MEYLFIIAVIVYVWKFRRPASKRKAEKKGVRQNQKERAVYQNHMADLHDSGPHSMNVFERVRWGGDATDPGKTQADIALEQFRNENQHDDDFSSNFSSGTNDFNRPW